MRRERLIHVQKSTASLTHYTLLKILRFNEIMQEETESERGKRKKETILEVLRE